MDEADKLDLVISRIYDAAIAPELWPTALATLAEFMGSWAVHYMLWNGHENTMPFSASAGDLDVADMERAYGAYYGSIDPRRQLTLERPAGELIACHQHFDDNYVAKSEFYNDFLIPFGGRFVTGTRLIDGGAGTAIIGVHRNAGQGSFGNTDLAKLDCVVPHLMRAAQIQQKLGNLLLREQSLESALDRVPWGICITDDTGKILALNAFARTVMQEGDGLGDRHGALSAVHHSDANELRRLIGEAGLTAAGKARHAGGSLSVMRGAERQPLRLLIAPHRGSEAVSGIGAKSSVIIFIMDPERNAQAPPQIYARLFGLTDAEAKLTAALASGRSLEECAAMLSKAKNTLRAQLQSVFNKTGTTRQSELVRLLAGIPPLLPPAE